MLIHAEKSIVLVVDIQEKLTPKIHGHEQVVQQTAWLMDIARILDIPVHATEQYPRGLGPTVAALRDRLDAERIHEKTAFGWPDRPEALEALPRPQVVLTGIEAHICVLQSAIKLRLAGRDVFVVADAIGSRQPRDYDLALHRLRQAGCWIVTREMVVFEWLEQANTDRFRDVLPHLKPHLRS